MDNLLSNIEAQRAELEVRAKAMDEEKLKGIAKNDKQLKRFAEWRAKNDYIIDPRRKYPEPDYTLYQGETGFLPKGDIQAVKAKSKNGKTFLCSIFAAAMLGNNRFGFYSDLSLDDKILYLDTEQNERNTAMLAMRMNKLMGIDEHSFNERFTACSLRTMTADERLDYLHFMLDDMHPAIVFIDGIADLMLDFNDIAESEVIINELMRLSTHYNCAIINVLHTNKAKDDNNMKGHLGTMLTQKASDVFEVAKDKTGMFTVTHTESRNIPVNSFSFTVDYDGIPQPMDSAPQKMSASEERVRKYWKFIFCDGVREITIKDFAVQWEEVTQIKYYHGDIKTMSDLGIVRIENVSNNPIDGKKLVLNEFCPQ